MTQIGYKRQVRNDSSEIHICYRCSDEYARYAPVAVYSVLVNNPERYIYFYFLSDGISGTRWQKIKDISQHFGNNEAHLVIADEADIRRQNEKSITYHGWGLINISIWYQAYFSRLKKVFNFGIDSYCVAGLGAIWDQDIEGYHQIGNTNRHQKSTFLKSSSRWIGMDISLIHLEQLRKDGITPGLMEDYTLEKLGYIHDEVAYNELGRKKYIDTEYYYIYSGSYLPPRRMSPNTRLVDYYNNLKPWEIAIPGYEVFDKYISYYRAASAITELEFDLPKDNNEVSRNLRNKGRPFVDWFPFGHRILGELIYRIIWAWKKWSEKTGVSSKGGKVT